MEFVNKSHISDKCIELTWNQTNLFADDIAQNINHNVILEYIINETGLSQEELLLPVNLEDVFYTIFAKQVYKGKREATVISWLLARITDGLGGKYPRELINLANYAKNEQIEIGSYETDCLISGRAIKRAFNKVSTTKCDTYLSEFPELREHFDRFSGKDAAKYSREELIEMMDGLEPSGDEMIRALMRREYWEAQHG